MDPITIGTGILSGMNLLKTFGVKKEVTSLSKMENNISNKLGNRIGQLSLENQQNFSNLTQELQTINQNVGNYYTKLNILDDKIENVNSNIVGISRQIDGLSRGLENLRTDSINIEIIKSFVSQTVKSLEDIERDIDNGKDIPIFLYSQQLKEQYTDYFISYTRNKIIEKDIINICNTIYEAEIEIVDKIDGIKEKINKLNNYLSNVKELNKNIINDVKGYIFSIIENFDSIVYILSNLNSILSNNMIKNNKFIVTNLNQTFNLPLIGEIKIDDSLVEINTNNNTKINELLIQTKNTNDALKNEVDKVFNGFKFAYVMAIIKNKLGIVGAVISPFIYSYKLLAFLSNKINIYIRIDKLLIHNFLINKLGDKINLIKSFQNNKIINKLFGYANFILLFIIVFYLFLKVIHLFNGVLTFVILGIIIYSVYKYNKEKDPFKNIKNDIKSLTQKFNNQYDIYYKTINITNDILNNYLKEIIKYNNFVDSEKSIISNYLYEHKNELINKDVKKDYLDMMRRIIKKMETTMLKDLRDTSEVREEIKGLESCELIDTDKGIINLFALGDNKYILRFITSIAQ